MNKASYAVITMLVFMVAYTTYAQTVQMVRIFDTIQPMARTNELLTVRANRLQGIAAQLSEENIRLEGAISETCVMLRNQIDNNNELQDETDAILYEQIFDEVLDTLWRKE
jgi:hypothetical protein